MARWAAAAPSKCSVALPWQGSLADAAKQGASAHRSGGSARRNGYSRFGGAAATMPDGWTAVAHPLRAWRGTLLPPLRIDAPSDVARGQPVRVRIAAPGRLRVAVQRRDGRLVDYRLVARGWRLRKDHYRPGGR